MRRWTTVAAAACALVAAGTAAAGVGLVAVPEGEEPPAGATHATQRLYRLELPGREGLLRSDATRIDGVVTLDDVRERRFDVLPAADARARVERLSRRFDVLHEARPFALGVLALFALAGALVSLRLRRAFAARAGVAIAPAVVSAALLLGLAGAARPAVAVPLLAAVALGLAIAAAATGRWFRAYGAGVLVLFLVVLAAWPETAGFASIGPRPEEAGRFYGINNVVSTTLLAITLWSGAALGRRALPALAALALVTIGWSEAGADGGGLIVFAVALAVLALRLAGRPSRGRAAVGVGAALVAVALLIALDLALGGDSHVTRAFEEGPAGWAAELGERLETSAAALAENWYAPLIVGVSLAALGLLGRRTRFPAGDALLAGIAVSLLVNDAPVDVAAGGALSYGVLWAWHRVNSAPDAPPRPAPPARVARASARSVRG